MRWHYRLSGRWIASGWLLLWLAVCALTLLVVGSAVNQTSAAGDKEKLTIYRGARLYVEYACVKCHEEGGRGRSVPPVPGLSLSSSEFKRSFPKGDPHFEDALLSVIKNGSILEGQGIASMPAWNGIIPEQDIRAIVAYIHADLPDLGIPPLPARTGEQVYEAFACIKCHGPLGVGGVKNVEAGPENQTIPGLGGPAFRKKFDNIDKVRQIVEQGKHAERGKAGVVFMPSWGRIGSPDQLDKVVGYIYR